MRPGHMADGVGSASTASFIEDSPLARFIFSDVRMAWVWLPLRLWVGWSWITAGWEKLQSPAWMGGGSALKGYWQGAGAVSPTQVITFGWYREFIQFLLNAQAYTWFAKVVTLGEAAVGIALILGAFTGLAAFTGGFLNCNYLMAGTTSTNAFLFAAATLLVLSWKTAGWIGLDRWLLQALGTPWRPGYLVKRGSQVRPSQAVPANEMLASSSYARPRYPTIVRGSSAGVNGAARGPESSIR